MTFLNPFALWGLLALAVPIILHFFNLQRPRQILFSNVAFVREVKKTVVKRIKFKQWLLLLSRLLALAAIVLAFTNPVLVNNDNPLLKGNRSVVLVIDNSSSMSAGNERGAYFPQAISQARNIIRAYTPEDEFLVMTTSDLSFNSNFSNQEEAIETLRKLTLKQNIRSHTEILSMQEDIFSRSTNMLQELYFLSDFQKATVMTDSVQPSSQDSNRLVKYLPFATRPQRNVYLRSHELKSQVIEKDKPVEMSMVLVNDGGTAIKDLSVRVLMEGKVVAINNKSLASQSEEELSLSFTPQNSGWLGGHIELDDNPVDFDNNRYFTLYVPEKEKVLIVEGENSRNVRILYESVFESFDVTFISYRNLSNQDLSEYRSLIFLGAEDISTGLASRLKEYLSGGGSMMFFPGSDLNLSRINTFLQGLQVGTFAPVINVQDGTLASVVELQHPIFDGIYEKGQQNREFDAPLILKYHPLTLNNSLVHNRIISLENQSPLLVESTIGKGKMYIFTVFPSKEWTDLHLKTVFTPLMFRATQLMNQTQLVQSEQEIGFFHPKIVRSGNQAKIDLVDSEGKASTPARTIRGGTTTLIFDDMELEEGIYDIVQENELLEKIAFNISDLESKLDYVSSDELDEVLEQKGFGIIETFPPVTQAIEEKIKVEKEGFPLWKYFVIAGLLFLLAEVLILKMKDT